MWLKKLAICVCIIFISLICFGAIASNVFKWIVLHSDWGIGVIDVNYPVADGNDVNIPFTLNGIVYRVVVDFNDNNGIDGVISLSDISGYRYFYVSDVNGADSSWSVSSSDVAGNYGIGVLVGGRNVLSIKDCNGAYPMKVWIYAKVR